MLKVNDLLNSQHSKMKMTVSPYCSISSVIKIMSEEKISALAVVENDEIVGLIEEDSILRKFYEDTEIDMNRPIYSIMDMKVLYVTRDYTIEECLALMSNKKIFYLPILENNKFLDMLSLHEIAGYLVEEKEYVIANLTQYISGNLVFNVNTALPKEVPEKVLDLSLCREKYNHAAI